MNKVTVAQLIDYLQQYDPTLAVVAEIDAVNEPGEFITFDTILRDIQEYGDDVPEFIGDDDAMREIPPPPK